MFKRCKFLLSFAAIVMLLILSLGCQSSKKSSNNDRAMSEEKYNKIANSVVKVLVWNPIVSEDFTDAVKVFDEKYNAKADFVMVTWGQIENKLVTSLAAGDSYDAVYWNQTGMPKYAIKGLIQPIEKYFDLEDPLWSDELDAMNQFKFKGKLYGVGGTYEGSKPFFVYFNKTIFENNGLKTPLEYYKEGKWNWVNFRKAAHDLTKDTDGNGLIDQWGLLDMGNAGYEHFALSNGGNFVKYNDDGSITLTINSQNTIDGIQFFQDMFYKDKSIGKAVKWEEDFASGKFAMALNSSWIGRVLVDSNLMKYEWDIVPFPESPSGTKGMSPANAGFWAIQTGAPNPEGAAELITLRHKTLKENEDELLSKYYSKEQIKMLSDIRKKTNIAKYRGIGNWDKNMPAFWKLIKDGMPVTSVVEQYIPIFQAEIDNTLKEVK